MKAKRMTSEFFSHSRLFETALRQMKEDKRRGLVAARTKGHLGASIPASQTGRRSRPDLSKPFIRAYLTASLNSSSRLFAWGLSPVRFARLWLTLGSAQPTLKSW
jgi:hypothetical protein